MKGSFDDCRADRAGVSGCIGFFDYQDEKHMLVKDFGVSDDTGQTEISSFSE